MKIYKDIPVQEIKKVCVGFTCNKCGKSFTELKNDQGSVDWIELQERFSYSFTGGYGSVFGDMCDFEIDLCQRCFQELLDPYITEVEDM